MPTAPNYRWAEAISLTGCDAAEIIEASGDQPRKIRCNKFTAEIVEAVPDPDNPNRELLVPTGEIVDVWHKFSDPMVAGASITIALRPDGRWTLIVWECDE